MSMQTRPTTVVSQPARLSIAGRVLSRQPDPRLLHRVLGVRPRPEHPVGDRHQTPALLLEGFRQCIVRT